MPKDTIVGIHNADGFDVQVMWGKEMEAVQVGLIQAAGFSIIEQLYTLDEDTRIRVANAVRAVVNQHQNEGHIGEDEALGRSIIEAIRDAVKGLDSRGCSSIWSTQGRAGINRLIRVLRRARDGAYGADE